MIDSVHWYLTPTPPGGCDAVHRHLAAVLNPGRARDYVYRVMGDRTLIASWARFKNLLEIASAAPAEIPRTGVLRGVVCPRRRIEQNSDIAIWCIKAGQRAGFRVREVAVRKEGPLRIHAGRADRATLAVWSVRFGYRMEEPARVARFLAEGSGRFKAFGIGMLVPDFVFQLINKRVA